MGGRFSNEARRSKIGILVKKQLRLQAYDKSNQIG